MIGGPIPSARHTRAGVSSEAVTTRVPSWLKPTESTATAADTGPIKARAAEEAEDGAEEVVEDVSEVAEEAEDVAEEPDVAEDVEDAAEKTEDSKEA